MRGFIGEPDEMRLGQGEFHEYPSSCVFEKPFNGDESSQDGNSSDQVLMNFKGKVSLEHVEENEGDKSLKS